MMRQMILVRVVLFLPKLSDRVPEFQVGSGVSSGCCKLSRMRREAADTHGKAGSEVCVCVCLAEAQLAEERSGAPISIFASNFPRYCICLTTPIRYFITTVV